VCKEDIRTESVKRWYYFTTHWHYDPLYVLVVWVINNKRSLWYQ